MQLRGMDASSILCCFYVLYKLFSKLLTRRLGRFAKVAALVCGRSCDALRVEVAAGKLLQRRQICPVASLHSVDQ